MASTKHSSFSADAKYFASCDDDGKLRIWETSKNALFQEFTPNVHLTSPCSCLRWLHTAKNTDTGTPSVKKRRKSRDVGTDIIALGTSNGRILLYSLASASVEAQLEGGHKSSTITSLSWSPGTNLYSYGGGTIAQWDVIEKRVRNKWTAGTEKNGCISVSPDEKYVLSATRSIKLWDAVSHTLLKTFTGHAFPILSLTFVTKPASNGDFYFISTAKGDRYMNVWSLGKSENKSAVVAMVLENEPVGSVSLFETPEKGTISLAAVTQSGVVQMFSHQLNGRCSKPLKPTLTIQVAMDSARGKESVEPLPILSVTHELSEEIRIAYGTGTFLAFENVGLTFEDKMQVLVRQDPRRMHQDLSSDPTLVKVPDTLNAQYLPQSAAHAVVAGVKRSHSRQFEVPMEERLENLSLSVVRPDDKPTSVPRADNLGHLMLQALQSKDKTMLHTVLLRREEDVIRNTVRKLPLQVIEPLLKELTTLLHAKTATAQTGARWLRIVLSIHAAHLMANPSLVDMLSPLIGLVESRLSLLPSLSKLSGRLDLLASQLDGAAGSDENVSPMDMQPSLLTYQDADTSDEDDVQEDAGGLGSESDDHWEELSDSDSNAEENDDDDDNEEDDDVEMCD